MKNFFSSLFKLIEARPFLVFIVFSLLTPSSSIAASELHALIISARDSYLENEQSLDYSALDAEKLARALRISSHVPNENITILTNPSLKSFGETVQRLRKKSKNKFLFYFSGHSDEKGLHFKDGLVSRTRFHDSLKSIEARTKIVILDSCFSGSLKTKGVKKSKPIDIVQYALDEPTGSVILTSSSEQEFSYESENLKGSIFTYHLVSGLYGQADTNSDGVVTINELYEYVYAKTKYQSLVSGGKIQHPEFDSKLSGRGALAVSFPAKSNGTVELPKEMEGELTLASLNGLNFFKFYKVKGESRRIGVPSGGYQATLEKSEGGKISVGKTTFSLPLKKPVKLASTKFRWSDPVPDKYSAKGNDGKPINRGETPETDSSDESKFDGDEFLFGFSLGGHAAFVDGHENGAVSEFFIHTPAYELWKGQWRATALAGSEQHKDALDNEVRLQRFSLGLEAGYEGFENWNQLWTFSLRIGAMSSKDDPTLEGGFSHLGVGMRFYPENVNVSWGWEIASEAFRPTGADELTAGSFVIYLAY